MHVVHLSGRIANSSLSKKLNLNIIKQLIRCMIILHHHCKNKHQLGEHSTNASYDSSALCAHCATKDPELYCPKLCVLLYCGESWSHRTWSELSHAPCGVRHTAAHRTAFHVPVVPAVSGHICQICTNYLKMIKSKSTREL